MTTLITTSLQMDRPTKSPMCCLAIDNLTHTCTGIFQNKIKTEQFSPALMANHNSVIINQNIIF